MTEAEPDGFTLSQSDESERKPRVRSRRRSALLLGLAITIVAVPFVLLAWTYSICPLIPIVSAGTSVSIASGSHVDYAFDVTKVFNLDRSIYGALNSSGPVIMYVTTSQQFSYWTTTGPPGPYQYSSSPVTSLSYSTCGGRYEPSCPPNSPAAPQGEDYLVLYNPGQTSITVTIGKAMVVQTC
jgi:hypothetical protein